MAEEEGFYACAGCGVEITRSEAEADNCCAACVDSLPEDGAKAVAELWSRPSPVNDDLVMTARLREIENAEAAEENRKGEARMTWNALERLLAEAEDAHAAPTNQEEGVNADPEQRRNGRADA
jgi:hypothetical protein